MQRDFKGIWIPKEIWLSKNISWLEKLLLTEIQSLDNENGCFATNQYFSEFFDLSTKSISRYISSLKEKGYIEIELIYVKGTKQIEKRIIRCMDKIVYRGMDKIVQDNNTNINNKNNNINIITKKKNKNDLLILKIEEYTKEDQLKNTLIDFMNHRKEIKSPLTERALIMLLKKLDQLGGNDDNCKIEILTQSIINGYKGIFEIKRGNYSNDNKRINTRATGGVKTHIGGVKDQAGIKLETTYNGKHFTDAELQAAGIM